MFDFGPDSIINFTFLLQTFSKLALQFFKIKAKDSAKVFENGYIRLIVEASKDVHPKGIFEQLPDSKMLFHLSRHELLNGDPNGRRVQFAQMRDRSDINLYFNFLHETSFQLLYTLYYFQSNTISELSHRQLCYTFSMIPILTSSFAGIISFIVLDYIWLAIIAKSFYLESLASHIKVEKGALVPYLPAIPLVYLVATLAIWVFVLSKVESVKDAAMYGALLGFFMYAFYDFTNLATLKDYPWSLTIVDILWGTFLVSMVTVIMYYVKTLLA